MSEKYQFIVGGATFGLVALWIGAYILHFANDSWWEFPMFITTMLAVILGYVVAVYGAVEL